MIYWNFLTENSCVDLECDYLNAQECCGRLNFWNIPKLWLQLAVVALLAASHHWLLVLLNLPVCVWLVRRFHYVRRGNAGEIQPSNHRSSPGCSQTRENLA